VGVLAFNELVEVSYAELSLRGEYKQSFDLGYNAERCFGKVEYEFSS